MPQCSVCQKYFNLTSADQAYFKKLDVPEPELCFSCTKIKQMVWRNERTFYLRKCDMCGKEMVSCFAADARMPVYCNDCWWSDKFDPTKYGQDFDFSRPFFVQFEELINKTPVGHLWIANSENSDYTNLCVGNKNCYMVTASDYNDTGAYDSYSSYNRDIYDCTETKNSELCYEAMIFDRCYSCFYSQNLKGCNNCYFCFNCNGCTDCVGCVNLRNQTHCFFNEKLSAEEYNKRLAELELYTYSGVQRTLSKFNNFKLQQIYPWARNINAERSSGDYLINCKNVINSFNMLDCEDCINCLHGDKSKDCYDCMGVTNSELVYNSVACPVNNNTKFSAIIWPGSANVYYSFLCRTANDCFGCVSLHNHRYCILNKQYTEEEYKKILPRVVEHLKKTGEWGQFFPMSFCPFGYNESVGQDLFPLTREEVLSRGGRWQDNLPFTTGKETITWDKIFDSIKDVNIDEIKKEILACQNCGRNYRLIIQELNFYKKLNIPLPRLCPNCRHIGRMSLRNPDELYDRQCVRCSKDIKTTYAPDRPEKIYCEECYQKEVY